MCLRWIPSNSAGSAASAPPRALVLRVRLELDPVAADRLERVPEQEVLRLDVRPRAPGRGVHPRVADLEPAMLGRQRHVARRADRPRRRRATANGWRPSLAAARTRDPGSRRRRVSIQVQIRSSAAGAAEPSTCSGPSGSSTTIRPSSRCARFSNMPIACMMHGDVSRHRRQRRQSCSFRGRPPPERDARSRSASTTASASCSPRRFRTAGVVVSSFDPETELITLRVRVGRRRQARPAILPAAAAEPRRRRHAEPRDRAAASRCSSNDVPEQVKEPARRLLRRRPRGAACARLPEEGPPGVQCGDDAAGQARGPRSSASSS